MPALTFQAEPIFLESQFLPGDTAELGRWRQGQNAREKAEVQSAG